MNFSTQKIYDSREVTAHCTFTESIGKFTYIYIAIYLHFYLILTLGFTFKF